MNIQHYVDVLNSTDIIPDSLFKTRHLKFFNGDEETFKSNYAAAIIGLPDLEEVDSYIAASQVRQNLYALSVLSNSLSIIDLGNLKPGSFNDNCNSLRDIISEIGRKTVIVLIGGSSSYSLGSLLAYEKSNVPVNMVCVNSTINKDRDLLGIRDVNPNKGNSYFNFINIGYQSYYVEKETLDFIEDSSFEAYRLGLVRGNLNEMEPVMRDANIVNFSLNAVKHSDAPGASNSSPNGLSGDEACQLAFFAGHSNRISSFGVFDFHPVNDIHHTTAKLTSHIIWYFLEGLSNAIFEEPDITPEHFTKYMIHLNQSDQNIAFYKSNLTNRWWMEISFEKNNYNIILSCSETDYELSCKQEIPDRWWRTFQRISG
jgi:formiminoglutamase